MDITDLVVENNYTNEEIVTVFGCSNQGGMRRSHKTNTLVLVSNQIGNNPYEDKWNGELLYYTGMGLKGNQRLDFAQNKTLNHSKNNGVEVHLFEVQKPKEYKYKGIVELVSEPFPETEKDQSGYKRRVYKFPLKIKK